MTYLRYLVEMRTSELPPGIVEAQGAFEEKMSALVRATSDDVAGRASSGVPDVTQSSEALRREIHKHYEQSGAPIPSPIAAMIALSQNLASIAAPLYRDVHATFTNPRSATMHHSETRLRAA